MNYIDRGCIIFLEENYEENFDEGIWIDDLSVAVRFEINIIEVVYTHAELISKAYFALEALRNQLIQ
ncbi:hypothetical protein Glove_67g80 [Diversispora epigaea]|uniref:Uncharacterized protein n=1 Tax=Diversispora epigaea TaxID=1348612 RepID=A0A397JJZ1_9GLOM|nr:hypothetical protein Glove_67g80 [Diversispora epigaea]